MEFELKQNSVEQSKGVFSTLKLFLQKPRSAFLISLCKDTTKSIFTINNGLKEIV